VWASSAATPERWPPATALPSPADPMKLTLGSDYVLTGISIASKLRYSIGGSIYATLCVPIGLDFGNGNMRYDALGNPIGAADPQVFPVDLSPEFKGLSVGVYIEISYLYSIIQ